MFKTHYITPTREAHINEPNDMQRIAKHDLKLIAGQNERYDDDDVLRRGRRGRRKKNMRIAPFQIAFYHW